jgi:hypothetical protein
MISWLSLFFLCALSSPCAQTDTNHPIIKQGNPPDSNPQYFPVGLFSKHPQLSEWRARWYAKELRGLEEPSLREAETKHGTAVYRLLLIPPFTPSLVIRLMANSDGTGTLVAKLGTKRGEGDETTPREQTVSVSPEQVSKFLHLFNDADFWSLPTAQPEEVGSMRFADAKEWCLEANKSGIYHVVDRPDGGMEVRFSRVCDYLQQLSPLKTETSRRKQTTSQRSVLAPD